MEELARACREGKSWLVRGILGRDYVEPDSDLVWEGWGPGKQTPLMWAASGGHLCCVKELIPEGGATVLSERVNKQV